MKVKLTAIMENDKPTCDMSEEKLKMIYQTFFNMLIIIGSNGDECSEKVTVIGAEIVEDE